MTTEKEQLKDLRAFVCAARGVDAGVGGQVPATDVVFITVSGKKKSERLPGVELNDRLIIM